MVRLTRPAYVLLIVLFLSGRMRRAQAQEPGRIKIAAREYRVAVEGNLGIGPIDTDVFHESWTLWRTTAGEYVLEGGRMFESPMGSQQFAEF